MYHSHCVIHIIKDIHTLCHEATPTVIDIHLWEGSSEPSTTVT